MIIGKKIGMTRIFSDAGIDIPATVIQAGPCTVTQIKSNDKDGYNAIQLGYDESKKSTKPLQGHFSKTKTPLKKYLKEFWYEDKIDVSEGDEITVESFEIGGKVDVAGVTKGKGFAGHMKRHGFSGGRKSHGKNSVMRKAGSIGASATPARVWKGMSMAGRMGNDKHTVKNLKVVRIDTDNNYLYISGAVPGAKGEIVFIKKN